MQKPPVLQPFSAFPKLLLLIALILICMIFTLVFSTFFAIPFWGMDTMDQISTLDSSSESSVVALSKYFQIASQLGMFVFPVLIFAFLDGRNILSYLKLNNKSSIIVFLLSGLSILLATPLINYLSELNMQMKLPSSMAGIEKWMRESEDKAGSMTEVFLNVKTTWGFLLNMLMIAIIPAFGEEFLFRGVLQPLFHRMTKSTHLAIIISAFLFSAIHMQFYGFIPRFMMGIFLGYAFAWTGSLWVPILIHFVNNGAAVVLSFLFNNGMTGNEFETIGTGGSSLFPLISSVILTVCGLFFIFHLSKKTKTVITSS